MFKRETEHSMNVKTIQVTAGRTFNHPHEEYSNLRPSVTMVAELAPGDDPSQAVKELQKQAEGLVEDHKQSLLHSLEELYQLSRRQAEVRRLLTELTRAQDRLTEIRKEHPELALSEKTEG